MLSFTWLADLCYFAFLTRYCLTIPWFYDILIAHGVVFRQNGAVTLLLPAAKALARCHPDQLSTVQPPVRPLRGRGAGRGEERRRRKVLTGGSRHSPRRLDRAAALEGSLVDLASPRSPSVVSVLISSPPAVSLLLITSTPNCFLRFSVQSESSQP